MKGEGKALKFPKVARMIPEHQKLWDTYFCKCGHRMRVHLLEFIAPCMGLNDSKPCGCRGFEGVEAT